MKFSRAYIYRFLRERNFQYGELAGSRKFFPKQEVLEIDADDVATIEEVPEVETNISES